MRAAYLFVFLLCGISIWLALSLLPHQQTPQYRIIGFDQLAGWAADAHEQALQAFQESCPHLIRRNAPAWLTVCTIADTNPQARQFFEQYFTPVVIPGQGLITGYHLPLLHGSHQPSEQYNVPLYRRPPELISVDLGTFRPEWRGRRLAGKRIGHQLLPMPDRSDIEEGAFDGRDLPLLWVNDPVEAFFLHIQGSGLVALPDGQRWLLGYDGANGHPYRSIGALLIRDGIMKRGEVTAQAIKRWLRDNPNQGRLLMRRNPSYIFFRRLTGDRPVGALGAPLTPRRSVAVDPAIIPLGTPVWLETQVPDRDDPGANQSFHRLMLAQDTGGAIKGANRADIYFGPGDTAADIAGRLQARGRTVLLLPKSLLADFGLAPAS